MPIQDFDTRLANYERRREELDINTLQPTSIDISTISGPAFRVSLHQTDTEIGSVTLVELDHLLEKRDRRTPYVQTRREAVVRPPDSEMDQTPIHAIEEEEPDALSKHDAPGP
ncbi:hypothetical protein PZA11_007998 [Diplocarpon coronariae]